MEIISGVNNWKLVVRRETEGIVVLRASTCDRKAALPEELLGLPVIALGDHALCPTAQPVAGEEVQVTCGLVRPDAQWDNREVEEVTLPASLRRVGNYAFMNCRGLRCIRLYDSIRFWGGSAFMNCRVLDTLYLQRVDDTQRESLYYFVDEMNRELNATIVDTNGDTARLVFPEYTEEYEENIPHHQFDFHIQGAGYPYHHVFQQRKLSLPDYDALWKSYLGMEYDLDCALRLAWWRLRWPVELTGERAAEYRAYLNRRTEDAIRMLLAERDGSGLAFLLEQVEPDKATLMRACDMARESGSAELLAILLEEQHRRFPAGLEKCFDL